MANIKYNIHQAINKRAHRKGLVNDKSLNFTFIQIQFHGADPMRGGKLFIESHPPSTYGIYYPSVYGKKHSSYKTK